MAHFKWHALLYHSVKFSTHLAMQKHLSQYRGPLTPAQAAEGINAAILNATRLAEDATLLLDTGRFATAASLAILAIEEQGKTGIIRGLVCAHTQEQLGDEWRRYRKHTSKNYLALMPDLARKGARRLSDLSGLFTSETASEKVIYDIVKQLGFYTDCCGAAHWSIPSEVIDEPLATHLVKWAAVLTREKESVTATELELWAQHMRTGQTSENLLKWCDAMVAAGLMSAEHAAGMRDFVSVEGNSGDAAPFFM